MPVVGVAPGDRALVLHLLGDVEEGGDHAEWRAIDAAGPVSVDARAGYRYEASPIPEQDGESSLGDSDKHIFSVGLGVELSGITKVLPRPIAFDGYVGLTYLPTRSFRKSDPRSAVGDFTVAGNVVQTGIQTRLSF